MPEPLPIKPNLTHIRNDAKRILKAQRNGNPVCIPVLKYLRRFARASDREILESKIALHEVQFSLALQYGFRSWRHLKRFIAASTSKRQAQLSSGVRVVEAIHSSQNLPPDTEPAYLIAHERIVQWVERLSFATRSGETTRVLVAENDADVSSLAVTPAIRGRVVDFRFEAFNKEGNTLADWPVKNVKPGKQSKSGRSSKLKSRWFIKVGVVPGIIDKDRLEIDLAALFAVPPTPEEMNRWLSQAGDKGRLMLDMKKMASSVLRYYSNYKNRPESLEAIGVELLPDVYASEGACYRYELYRNGFVLYSCGKDGEYGTDDDEVFIYSGHRSTSGNRGELWDDGPEGGWLFLKERDKDHFERTGWSGRGLRGDCSVSGKVVASDTGKPISHARVYLFCMDSMDALFEDAADHGGFAFRDIPGGSYRLRTTHTAGYQDAQYNPENKEHSAEFALADGERRSGIVLKADPAYRISGRAYDPEGKTPQNLRTLGVFAWSRVASEKKEYPYRYRVAQQARVDWSTGSYTIDGLNGEPVYIMVVDWKKIQDGMARPLIYYPGTFFRGEAEMVSFHDAKEVGGMDIRLKQTGGLSLEGVIVDAETKDPIPEAFVAATRDDMLFDLVTGYTDEKGRYKLEGLGQGRFSVHVDAVHRGYVRKRRHIDIYAAEKNDADFELRLGGKISGRFVDEKGGNWAIHHSHGTVISGPPPPGSFSGFPNKHRAKSIGDNPRGYFFLEGEGDYETADMIFPTENSFIVEGILPRRIKIFFYPRKERGLTVKEIRYEDRDIAETGIEIQPGQELNGIVIVIGIGT
jgi:hypothetical protein